MKKILSILAAVLGATTATYAADMPAKAPAAPAVFNWSGYLGVEGGGSWGRSSSVGASGANVGSTLTSFELNGGLAGGTIGCNLQIDNFVFGLEGDYSWTNEHDGANDRPPFPATTTNALNEQWINTLRGRVGYAFDRFLVYGTAGGALAGTEVVVSNPANGRFAECQSRSGWLAGVGGAWAAWSWSWVDVSFKVEYLHADFGSEAYFSPPPGPPNVAPVTRDVRLSDDIVRAGVNLKFNSGGGTGATTKQ